MNSDDLNNRLTGLDKSIQNLTNRIERHIDITQIHQNNMSQIIEDHKRILYGNGENGLLARIERIETRNKTLSTISISGLMAGIGAIGTFLIGFFKWQD